MWNSYSLRFIFKCPKNCLKSLNVEIHELVKSCRLIFFRWLKYLFGSKFCQVLQISTLFTEELFTAKVVYNKMQWRNWGSTLGALGAIALSSGKSLSFLKEHKNWIILFDLLHLNFCPAIGKCYSLSISLEMSITAAKITHNESFKDNDCSIAM